MKLPDFVRKQPITTREEFLSFRKSGFGGSDFGALCGLSQYRSAYATIVGKWQASEDTAGECAYWGNVLEPVVADEFERRNPGLGKIIDPKGYALVDTRYPYMLGNLDRILEYADGSLAPIEIKTSGSFALNDWQKGILPQAYVLQATWYARFVNADHFWLVVLVGGQTFLQFRVDVDPNLIAAMEQMAHQYWPYVERQEVPPAELMDLNDLSKLFAVDNGTSIELDDDTDNIIAGLEAMKAKEKEISKHIDGLELKLKQRLTDAEMGVTASSMYAKWKTTNTVRFNGKKFQADHPELYAQYQETSSSRRLSTGRLKQGGKGNE